MGLRGWLLRCAAVRPVVLVTAGAYGTRARLLVEAAMAERGWRAARSPGEASVLVVCGAARGEMGAAVEVVWEELPGPRARVELAEGVTAGEVARALDGAERWLGDEEGQLRDAAERGVWHPGGDHEDHGDSGHGTHGDHGMPGEGHDMHGGGDRGGHGHHMGSPGGLKMAERGDDRDGLKLDQLHVPLGPVLVDWPGGLVVETIMQGDVIQRATARVADGDVRGVGGGGSGGGFWDEPWRAAADGHQVTRGAAERRRAAAHLDSLGRLLAVAGWPGAARDAGRLRDRTLAGEPRDTLAAGYARFARRVRRSKVLTWMLHDLGRTPPAQPDEPGDVLGRMRRWLELAEVAIGAVDDTTPLGDEAPEGMEAGRTRAVLSMLPGLLEGAELAAARLIVASFDPDLSQPAQETAHA